ncbi:MAG: LamG domain-containing protein [Steroidobacter sp.]
MRASNLSMFRIVSRLAAVTILGAFGLAGCGGGASTSTNPNTAPPTAGPNYTGPAPATSDIQAFRVNFWENIRGADRCGNCHNAGGQAPQFARSDDVNQAYQQANGVVNRDNPSQSTIVTKVAGGHNCWRGDPAACASDLTRWIQNWVGAAGNGGKQIELIEPPLRDPAAGKRFPSADDPNPPTAQTLFRPVYEKLDLWCSGCHQSNSATAQSPYFAEGSFPTDVNMNSAAFKSAYNAAIPKINLDNPALSRFVIRLRDESHNCFSNCADDARELQDLIQAMADQIPVPDIDTTQVLSKALTLYDGTVASGGSRYEANMIALYEFKTGQGTVAFDTSGVAPAADLNFLGDVTWVGGWGINIRGDNVRPGKAQASTTSSRKFHSLITATGEYSIEAWVVPANVTQEDARIVSYSGSTTARNFTLGQQLYNYEAFGRSTATGANGAPELSTDDDAERLQASLQHVVMTFDPVAGRRIYVNGEFTGDVDGSGGGTLGDWDNSFAFVLGNEVSNNRQWQGVVRLVAVHNRALNAAQIKQNFDAGVGEKFFLLFGISHIVDVPKSYIMFEVTQYDSFSYLFTNPKYISLDATAMPGNIPLKGMRIGVNGVEAQVGQAYRLIDTAITSAQYSAATGTLISSVGTVIPLEQGPILDEFFLCFEQLGARSNVCTTFTPGTAPTPVDGVLVSDIGVKRFDAINATMASVTGVSPNNARVKATYNNVRQSLPAVNDINGFLSSHQTSIAQLALQYCSVMMDDSATRSAFFGGGVNFSSNLAPGPERTAFVDALFNKGIGVAGTQPADTTAKNELDDLIGDLCAARACGSQRTIDVLKAACAATLGSAAVLVQ